MAVGIKHIDKAVALACHIVVLLSVLLRIGDEEIAIDVRYAEGRVACRNPRILEIAVSRGRGEESVGSRRAEHVDRAGTEGGREEEYPLGVDANHKTFIDGAVGGIRQRRIVDREYCVVRGG